MAMLPYWPGTLDPLALPYVLNSGEEAVVIAISAVGATLQGDRGDVRLPGAMV